MIIWNILCTFEHPTLIELHPFRGKTYPNWSFLKEIDHKLISNIHIIQYLCRNFLSICFANALIHFFVLVWVLLLWRNFTYSCIKGILEVTPILTSCLGCTLKNILLREVYFIDFSFSFYDQPTFNISSSYKYSAGSTIQLILGRCNNIFFSPIQWIRRSQILFRNCRGLQLVRYLIFDF